MNSRIETMSEKTSKKIQIFARISQLLASSFRRTSIFHQIITELSKYYPQYKICALLKTSENKILVLDEKSGESGREIQDLEFSKIIKILGDLQQHNGQKFSYSILDTVLLSQYLNDFIYPFALLTEEKIQGYLVISLPSVIAQDEHLFFTDTATLMSSALQNVKTTNERNFINEQFGRSVDEKVRDYLLKNQDAGSIQEVSVMFFDIRNFTTLSEKLGPTESVLLLNKIFSDCDQIIRNQNGFINKFTGDGFMAVFGAPLPTKNHQVQAVKSALEILQKTEIPCGIGIASGLALAGTIGSNERKEYTVIGDTVNTASRVEGMCKIFGSSLVVTGATFEVYKRFIENENTDNLLKLSKTRFLGKIRLKGKSAPVQIFDLLSQNACYSSDFSNAIDFYYKKEFSISLKILQSLQNEYQNDKAILWYINKCQTRINSQEYWDGIETMTEK